MQYNLNAENLWLVGCGAMAIQHAKALENLGVKFNVIGRGEDSARKFTEETGIPVLTGGIGNAAETLKIPQKAIVVIDVEALSAECCHLIDLGVKSILLEKPAGLSIPEVQAVVNKSKAAGATVYIAYNRRFYASVQKAKEIIREDGGVTSFNCEFTEWGTTLLKTTEGRQIVLDHIFFVNSTHPLDLAFFLGGTPKELSCYTTGSCSWCTQAKAFAGAGITDTGALFSYQANWDAPGRWSVEVLTAKHRLILRPMEQLQIQNINSVKIEPCEIDDKIDHKYKAGLYMQAKAFLEDDTTDLIDIEKHRHHMDLYERIRTGS